MRNLSLLALLVLALCGVAIAGPGMTVARAETGHEGHDHAGHDHGHDHGEADDDADGDEEQAATSGDPFYLPNCPVMGVKLGAEAIKLEHEGREFRFCCTNCVAKFKADPQKYITEIDVQMIADQLPYYPLTTCPVTDADLGEMGGAVDIIHNNRLVRFCCAGCIDEFKSNPEPYLQKLDDAAKAKQAAAYPLQKCIVLPDEAYEDEHTIVVAGRVFKLCCGGCEAEVRSNPADWIAKLEAAWKQ